MNLALVSAAYPPDCDGIGDYTWWMAKTLAERDDIDKPVKVFTRTGGEHTPWDGVEVIPFFDRQRPRSFCELARHLTADSPSPDWLILQYNPFGYGHRGFCPSVPRTLRLLGRRCPNMKIAVMFHEIATQEKGWRSAVMRVWQSVLARKLAYLANICFYSTEAYLKSWRRTTELSRHLPAGSNLPDSLLTREQARSALAIAPGTLVIGSFGTTHPSRQFHWMAEAARKLISQGRAICFVAVGTGAESIQSLFSGIPFKAIESPIPSKAAAAIKAFDIFLSPYTDGISTRRGSVIAALQHGIPVVTTETDETDGVFKDARDSALIAVPAGGDSAFVAAVSELASNEGKRLSIGKGGLALFEKTFRWNAIADQMLTALNNEQSILEFVHASK